MSAPAHDIPRGVAGVAAPPAAIRGAMASPVGLRGSRLDRPASLRKAHRHRAIQACWDAGMWLIALPVAVTVRYDFDPSLTSLTSAAAMGALLGGLQVAIGYAINLYRGRYRVGSFDEVRGVVTVVAILAVAQFAYLVAVQPEGLPRSVAITSSIFALVGMLTGRFVLRLHRERTSAPREGTATLIYGAGDSGDQLVRLMLARSDSGYLPVGFLDDDPAKSRLAMHGVPVLGGGSDLEVIARRTGAGTLLVAMAGVDAATLLDLDRRCRALRIDLRVIPTASEIANGAVKLGDISDVKEEDLLGRRPIDTDEEGIAAFLRGRRILITGAGGSIGSELARQVHRYAPEYVALLDRDESALHAVQLSIDGRGLLDTDNLILADIRDADRIREVFEQVRPDIVFHAAALKHLPLLQRYPEEAYKTNVFGTQHVLDAADLVGVCTFINISTDKAADPTSVLGGTKLETERRTARMTPQETSQGRSRFLSVRFGNVLGSRGSVLEAFRYQIAKGGPVTVTDPDVTRYFMTIPEAVHLVLQASVIGDHGETLILDMGEPVRIDDVARYMIDKSGRDIEIVYTGLRPGEKMTERLISKDEHGERRAHPLISHTRPDSLGNTLSSVN